MEKSEFGDAAWRRGVGETKDASRVELAPLVLTLDVSFVLHQVEAVAVNSLFFLSRGCWERQRAAQVGRGVFFQND